MHKFFLICSTAMIATTTLLADGPNKARDLALSKAAAKSQGDCCTPPPPPPPEKKCCPPVEKICLSPAYNAPAAIDVRGWDVDVFGSFLYWHISQDAMDVAHVTPTSAADSVLPGAVAIQKFEYAPGFKVGVGMNGDYDGWVGWIEYTWLHNRVSSSQTAPALPSGGAGTWTVQDWFTSNTGITGQTVTSSWKMHLDMVDAMFSRPFYQGTKITLSPYAGLRGLFIRQDLKIALGAPNVDVKSKSWAVGPNTGVSGHWMLGNTGFRFEGKAAGSLLYTRYTKVTHTEQDVLPVLPVTTTSQNFGAVRPAAELGVGLGWGSYLACNSFYMDFAVRYDFMLLWEQNVMRQMTAYTLSRAEHVGDLQLHGLTASARFDF